MNPRRRRSHLRRLLRQAVRGDAEAFVALADPYFDLITEYLVLSGITKGHDLHSKAAEILHEIWKFLPFMHRVSDFERILVTTLFSVRQRDRTPAENPCRAKLQSLNPREKVAFLARDFENWDYGWTATALRVPRKDLGEILIGIRCGLLGIDLADLDKDSATCIRKLSLDFDGQHSPKEKKRICQRLGHLPKAREFKSGWLNLRCELIELRQEIRLPEEEKEALLNSLIPELRADAMIQVPLLERFANWWNFRQTSATAI